MGTSRTTRVVERRPRCTLRRVVGGCVGQDRSTREVPGVDILSTGFLRRVGRGGTSTCVSVVDTGPQRHLDEYIVGGFVLSICRRMFMGSMDEGVEDEICHVSKGTSTLTLSCWSVGCLFSTLHVLPSSTRVTVHGTRPDSGRPGYIGVGSDRRELCFNHPFGFFVLRNVEVSDVQYTGLQRSCPSGSVSPVPVVPTTLVPSPKTRGFSETSEPLFGFPSLPRDYRLSRDSGSPIKVPLRDSRID